MDRSTLEKAKDLDTCIDRMKELHEILMKVHAPNIQGLSTALLTDDVLNKWRTMNIAFFETQLELKGIEFDLL